MYILGIETTGPKSSVALMDEAGSFAVKASEKELNHLKDLTPMIEYCLKAMDCEKEDVGAVAVSVGPGSFTGIRIGVSTGRAIAQALNVPCIPVDTLRMFKQINQGDKVLVPMFYARRGQAYGAIFGYDNEELLEPGLYQASEVIAKVPTFYNVYFYGDGADAYVDVLGGYNIAEERDRYQSAYLVVKEGWDMYRNNQTVPFDQLLPNYMKETEAEEKLKNGTLEKERAQKLEKFKAK